MLVKVACEFLLSIDPNKVNAIHHTSLHHCNGQISVYAIPYAGLCIIAVYLLLKYA